MNAAEKKQLAEIIRREEDVVEILLKLVEHCKRTISTAEIELMKTQEPKRYKKFLSIIGIRK